MKIIVLFIFLTACQSIQPAPQSSLKVRKQWIINTLSEPYLKTKIIQKTPTLITSHLIIQGDSLYGVRAYDKDYGNMQWFLPVTGGIEGGIFHGGKRIFFGGADGFLYSLETTTGKILWKFFTGAQNPGTPYMSEGIVYFLTSKGKVYALNAETGRVVWIYNQPSAGRNDVVSIYGQSQPIVDKKAVYVGFRNGHFTALDKFTGRWIWNIQLAKKTKSLRDSDSHPVIAGNLIYTSSYEGGFFCLNKHTGKVVWKSEKGAHSSPAVKGRFIYYSTTDNHITALNRFNGKKIWQNPTESLATQPVIYKSSLIYGLAKGGLVVIDMKSGKIISQVNLFRGISAQPVLDSRYLYVMSIESWLYKLKLLF